MLKIRLNTFFLGFVVFDLLLLPKFLFSTPISFFILPLLVVSAGRFTPRMTLAYTCMLVILLSSLIYSLEENNYFESENLKRIIQLSLIMALCFLNYREVDYYRLTSILKKIISSFYLISIIFLLLMWISPNVYEVAIRSIYPEAASMISQNLGNLRFSFHFTDPNSFGYLVVLCVVLVFCIFYNKNLQLLFLSASFLLVIATQSRGALLALFVVAFLYWLFFINYKFKLYSLAFALLFPILFLAVFFEYIEFYWELYQQRQRIEENIGKGIGGGRLDAWYYFFHNFNINPFFGVGYHLEKQESIFRPHSDFIRLQLSYGTFIFFILFLFFNGFGRKYLMLWVAFFVPFMINTIIDDYRLFGLFIALFFILKWGERISPSVLFPRFGHNSGRQQLW